jgi:hypothetical protein
MPIKSDKKLLKQWDKHRHISEGSLEEQHTEARNDHAFYAGDQMAYTATVTDKSRRAMVVFNKVKPYVDAVTGFMIQLRRKPEYLARIFDNLQQIEFSNYLNSLSEYARQNANMDHLESAQDREMLITGYGALDTNVVYELNPDGEIAAENVQFDDIYWDPQSREPNLLDSRWVFRRKKFSRDEAVKRFRGSKPEDFESYKGEQTQFVYNPDGGLYDKIALGVGVTEEDLVEVFYYQWWELQTYYRAKNPLFELTDPFVVNQLGLLMETMRLKREEAADDQTQEDYFEFDPFAEFLVMTPSIRTDMEAAFKQFDIDVDYQVHQKRVYYTAVITGEKILLKFRSPDQQGFTIKFKTGDYDHENERWFGMVASLKHPARYANKSLTEMLYVIASNSKGGVMYEESAVEDPARFEQQWATTRSAIKVNDGAIAGGQIAPKANASLPNGYENIYAISNESMGEVTGINKEFLGSAQSSQVSALLETQRINQVVSTLACYFDSIVLYQKEHARLMVTFIKMLAENSEGRLVKILGDDGAPRFEELSQERLVEEYDVDIGEAPTTATQRQETTQIMMELADKLALLGQNIYPIVVQYLPIKATDKQKLLEALAPPEVTPEQQQQQAAIAQLQFEGQAAEIAKTQGEAVLKQAQAAKTTAEVPQTEAETDKTRAETLESLAQGEQKNLENDVIKTTAVNNLDVVI